jgi:hypothetical protein
MPLIPSLNGRIINHFEGWILKEEGRDKCSHHSVFQSLKMDSFSEIRILQGFKPINISLIVLDIKSTSFQQNLVPYM